MKIKVTYEGTSYEITKLGPIDFVSFERHFKTSAAKFEDEESVRFEWLCFLVHRGLKRLGVIEKRAPFDDDFLEKVEEIDYDSDEEADDESDPTTDQADQGQPAA